MPRRNFNELREAMGPERRAEVAARVNVRIEEMVLAELRKHTGQTQEQLASALGIKQPSLSKLEGQDDMQISTLRRLVEALGGELELTVRLPGGSVRLTQFEEPVSSKG